MSKPAAERPLWVHQDRLNLPFPAVQGTALLLKARFLLSGMGRCVKFFSLREGFFFALLLIFPFRQEKSGAQTRIKEACHKIYIAIRRNGDFFTGRSKKHTTCGSMKQKKSPATSRIGGCPKRPCRRGKQRDEKALLRLLEAFLPQDPGAGCEAAQDSGRDPQPGTAFFPKKAGGGFSSRKSPLPSRLHHTKISATCPDPGRPTGRGRSRHR